MLTYDGLVELELFGGGGGGQNCEVSQSFDQDCSDIAGITLLSTRGYLSTELFLDYSSFPVSQVHAGQLNN